MHYYAFYHDYGVNMRYAADNLPFGTLHVFSSRRARDEWVRDERYEGGNVHRDIMGSREARKLIVDFVVGEICDAPAFVDAEFYIDDLITKAREYLLSEEAFCQFGIYGRLYIHEEAEHEH